jgi:hypothetical protein
MQYFAASALVYSHEGLAAEFGSRNVQLQYLHVVINHERRDRNRVEYRTVKRLTRLCLQAFSLLILHLTTMPDFSLICNP